MKWLRARAYDNGVYVVFSNPIGMNGDQLKNGYAMVLDPFGGCGGGAPRVGGEGGNGSMHERKTGESWRVYI